MDISDVLHYLPHRYPFLLVDRVLNFVPNESLTGLKNVTFNEPYFPGHFPVKPIMPGVLIIEALAQATGILAFKSEESMHDRQSMYYLVGVDKARFKQPVEPGDQLILQVDLRRIRQGIGVFSGEARVDDKVVASAELMCAKRDL